MKQSTRQYASNTIKLYSSIESPRYGSTSISQIFVNNSSKVSKHCKEKKHQSRHCRMKTADNPAIIDPNSQPNTLESQGVIGSEKQKKNLKHSDKNKTMNSTRVISLKSGKGKCHKVNSLQQNCSKFDSMANFKNQQSTVTLRSTTAGHNYNNLNKSTRNKKIVASMGCLKEKLSRSSKKNLKTQETYATINPQCFQKASNHLKTLSVASDIKQPKNIADYQNLNRKLMGIIEHNKKQFCCKIKQKNDRYKKKEQKLVDKVNQIQGKNTRLITFVNYMKKMGINTDQIWNQLNQKKIITSENNFKIH